MARARSTALHFTGNDADRRLLALYPCWRAAMKKWDAAHDRADEYPHGKAPRSINAKCEAAKRTLMLIMDEVINIDDHGPIGALVKLTIFRTEARSEGSDLSEHAYRNIAMLARAAGLEPYDYVSTTNLREVA